MGFIIGLIIAFIFGFIGLIWFMGFLGLRVSGLAAEVGAVQGSPVGLWGLSATFFRALLGFLYTILLYMIRV